MANPSRSHSLPETSSSCRPDGGTGGATTPPPEHRPAVRQLAHRAREHVQARRPRYQPDPSAQRAATERFLAAAVGGDLHGLLEVLAPT
jgi:hypothetical protein